MAHGRQGDTQGELMVGWAEMPRSPGHVFYDRRQAILTAADFAPFVETLSNPFYGSTRGRPSLPPGHLVGYFEGINSEQGLELWCADSLSLREFLLLAPWERVPDHSGLSKTRSRSPVEVHAEVFDWVFKRLAEHDLIKGERLGVDAPTIEANVVLRIIVRRDNGETYRQVLRRMAEESGIDTPTTEDLIRMDRQRTGKKLSNADWTPPVDGDARIAPMRDDTTHLAYKPEHG